MGIVHVRIDDRLIHGQVASFWSNALGINRIMVANDAVAADDMQKSVLRMVAPTGVSTSIISKEVAARNIKAGKYDREKVLLILKSPKDAIDLIDLGVDIKSINVGNMAHKDNTVQIKKSVNVTEEDVKNFNVLHERGIELTAIMVPDEPKADFMDFLKKYKSN